MSDPVIRPATSGDLPAAYRVCLQTGDRGGDATPLHAGDPDALGRIYVGPYIVFEPEFSLVIEDGAGVCGYALGALDSRTFYARFETEWRPPLCAAFPEPQGDPDGWTETERTHHLYHHPDYFCPEPYDEYPSHLHIDLLPRVQGRGFGRRMLETVMRRLRQRGSPGAHLGVSALNTRAIAFYRRLGFEELTRVDAPDGGCIYMGRRFEGGARD